MGQPWPRNHTIYCHAVWGDTVRMFKCIEEGGSDSRTLERSF